ncbi:hypothetical protein OKW21_005276 [Catalinimonas alkaloidigena]|uniref:DUF6503 family protein n=1 Tax=Catalinimonas alkaloidigena TaxID=1075417 RepID=UPI0024065EE1|nr:DUF6503 family protein [Catalinimonas alkaloidigena]MDF9800013.1 hypothetical protein [Catalinimonas alkaloidigena]
MKKSMYVALLLFLFAFACQTQSDKQQNDAQHSNARHIIDQAIAVHGGEQLENTHISFDFRKRHYEVDMNGGQYLYESFFEDSIGRVHDALNNKQFTREVNGEKISLSDKDSLAYKNSLNSVVYFALLPYFLNDPAVNKKLLGETTIKGEPYDEIQVTFDQEGGGTDHEDVYIYWIHQQDKTMDYLAYSFHVEGGGTRFREAYNVREIEGIRFADYINYESTVANFALENYETLFEEGKVEELSRIDLENIRVTESTGDPAISME